MLQHFCNKINTGCTLQIGVVCAFADFCASFDISHAREFSSRFVNFFLFLFSFMPTQSSLCRMFKDCASSHRVRTYELVPTSAKSSGMTFQIRDIHWVIIYRVCRRSMFRKNHWMSGTDLAKNCDREPQPQVIDINL